MSIGPAGAGNAFWGSIPIAAAHATNSKTLKFRSIDSTLPTNEGGFPSFFARSRCVRPAEILAFTSEAMIER